MEKKPEKTKKWKIVLYRYDDSKVWMRSGLMEDSKKYVENLLADQYIDKKSVREFELELPE